MTIINYDYDPLYRLTAADYYYTNEFYHYTYDAVGNRLTASNQSSETSYQYDVANRLTDVNGVAYTFDANGNLLNDGVNFYTYDYANRPASVNGTTTYTYNGLGDRLSQDAIHYTLDLNSGLTQVLTDGENTYTYGLGRISQEQSGNGPEYFLADALGSVRQLTDPSGQVTLAKAYDPYGVVTASSGTSQTMYGFTSEQADVSGLVYLRSRYYNSTDGRFMSRDTWGGEANRPMSLNRWGYVEGNPVTYTDPSGRSICYDPLPASCQLGLAYVNGFAGKIKELVASGSIQPVEGFATLADLSKSHFNGDIRDLVWAMTIVLNDFDANRGAISGQVLTGGAGSHYWIHQDWLPYRNDPEYDDLNWGAGEYGKWIHSLRGDWSEKYWDKTANQAYHFWGLLAITFFDGRSMGDLANWQHDGNYPGHQQGNYDYSHSNPNVAPPKSGISKPDYDLSLQAIALGDWLRLESDLQNQFFRGCEEQWKFVGYTDIGQWIRVNLKG